MVALSLSVVALSLSQLKRAWMKLGMLTPSEVDERQLRALALNWFSQRQLLGTFHCS